MATRTNIRPLQDVLQLRIELKRVKPKVWRRVLVPGTITLQKLHLVIQAAFGWGHCHLHEFVTGEGERFGESDPDFEQPGDVRSERIRLITVVRTATLSYTYDFGDDWEHSIKVERTLDGDIAHLLFNLPTCVAGANAAPPDDCGGAGGYEEFVEIMADPTHPEHEDMTKWVGQQTWDPTAFDVDAVNVRLANINLRSASRGP
jgi:hypothetical protein